MKVLSRDFTLVERLLLLLFSLVLVALAYYQFVDRPVRTALASARAEADSLSMELTNLTAQVAKMRSMREELDDVTVGGTASEMGSYNNVKAEIESLNEILGDTIEYTITFANVSRTGNQIRRNVSLSFKVDGFESLERVVGRLSTNHHRCLIGDLRVSSTKNSNILEGDLNVSTMATFYETMVGGVPDAGLPESSAAAK